MISATAKELLLDRFGSKRALTEKEDLLTFGYDATPGLQGPPDIVLFPETTEEVGFIVTLANKERVPIIPRGSGTGLLIGGKAGQPVRAAYCASGRCRSSCHKVECGYPLRRSC